MKRLSRMIALVLFFATSDVRAQPPSVDPAEQLAEGIRAAANRVRASRTSGAPGGEIGLARDLHVIALGLGGVDERNVWALMEEGRTDKQIGAAASASGSTSLVSKGGVPGIIALALEHGALTREQSGTTLTFRGTPLGIIKALGNAGYLDTYTPGSDPALSVLQKLSFHVSFDTTRGNDGAFTGEMNQVSSIGGRLTLVDHRDPRQARHRQRWRELVPTQLSLTQADDLLDEALEKDPAFVSWLQRTNSAVANASDVAVEDVLREQIGALRSLPVDKITAERVGAFSALFKRLLDSRAEILRGIERGAQVALDYTNDRPESGFDTSNLRLVGSAGGSVEITGNASVTFFNDSLPPGVNRRTRDVQGAVQLDIPMGRPDGIGRYSLSLAYRYERLLTDVPGIAGAVTAAKKGTVSVGQLKLTIPIRGSPAKIPVSITFANRSELIEEKVIRGNIGLTYDLDAVFARFKP